MKNNKLKTFIRLRQEKDKRLPPKPNVLRELYINSGGICACPDCTEKLYREGTFIGEVCHIESVAEGGARYNKALHEQQKRAYRNLILLCRNCHKVIDDIEKKYTVDILYKWKEYHQTTIETKLQGIADEQVVPQLTEQWEKQIDELLTQIKARLNTVDLFKQPAKVFEKEGSYEPNPKRLEEDYYFSKSEKKAFQAIEQNILQNNANIYLITGSPSVGKTTGALRIAKNLEKENYKSYYLDLKNEQERKPLFVELDVLKNHPTVVILDNIHLNDMLAVEFYQTAENYPNISFLFLSRNISETLQKTETGLNLYKEIEHQYNLDKLEAGELLDKIEGIARNRQKDVEQRTGKRLEIGHTNRLGKLVRHNLLKLTLALDAWEEIGNRSLDTIDNRTINHDLFNRYMKNLSKEAKETLVMNCAVAFLEADFELPEQEKQRNELNRNGLIFKKPGTDYYTIYHPVFAGHLLAALVSRMEDFDRKYNNDKVSFMHATLKEYILSFQHYKFKPYPKNLNRIVLGAVQNSKQLFNLLIEDRELQPVIINYFRNEISRSSDISDFFDTLSKQVKASLTGFYFGEIATDNKQFQEAFNNDHRGAEALKDVMFAAIKSGSKKYNEFKREYLSQNDVRTLFSNSALNSSTYAIRYIYDFDEELARGLVEALTVEEWAKLFNRYSLTVVTNSLIEIGDVKRDYASGIYEQLNAERLAKNSIKVPLIKFTKALRELQKFGGSKAEDVYKAVNPAYLQMQVNVSEIVHVTKALNELKRFDETQTEQLIIGVSEEAIVTKMRHLNPSNFARIFSELMDVSAYKVQEVVKYAVEHGLLEQKIKEAKQPTQLAHFFFDLKKVVPDIAKTMVRKVNNDAVVNKLRKSTIKQDAEVLQAIKNIDKDKAKAIYIQLEDELLKKRILWKGLHFTSLPVLNTLKGIDRGKTGRIYRSIDDYVFIQKAKVRQIDFRDIGQALKSLKGVDVEKTVRIFKNLGTQHVFKRKMEEANPVDYMIGFFHFYKIDSDTAIKKLLPQLDTLMKEKQGFNYDFSNFSDGLEKLNRCGVKKVRDMFVVYMEDLREAIRYSKFRQITFGLGCIMDIQKTWVGELFNGMDDIVEIIEQKAVECDSQNNYNGAMGELRKASPETYSAVRKRLSSNSKFRYKL